MFAKVGTATIGAIILIPLLIATSIHGAISAVFGGGSSQPSTTALADIPADYLTLYLQAAHTCPGLDWTILAAIGKIESDHGRSTLPGVTNGENHAGAGGPMQILQSTWNNIITRHQIPPGGAQPPSRYNPHDAVHAAAFYLCDNGAGHDDLRTVVFAYNHLDSYVDQVLVQASQYAHTSNNSVACAFVPPAVGPADQFSGNAALIAVAFACAQLGKPYIWGGDGEPGFDCSGLTHAAYATAGITIPRTAQTQYNAGPLLPADVPLAPGDLIFFGTPDHVHHVGISLGGTLMVNAPTFGQKVRVQDYRDFPDHLGVSRPAGIVAP